MKELGRTRSPTDARARALMLVLALALFCASTGCGVSTSKAGRAQINAEGRAGRVTIARDDFGVPYVEGRDEADVAYGVAYAMAEDGYYALEEAYAFALGRGGAYYGQVRYDADVLRAGLGVTQRAQDEYAALGAVDRGVLQAFTEGLNAYMRDHAQQPPRHIMRFEPWMPIALANEVTWVQAAERAIGAASDTSAWVTLAIAIGPARAAGGALLLVASHGGLPYEVNLRTADGWSFHGFASLGLPFARDGFSTRIAFVAGEEDVRRDVVTSGESLAHVAATDTLRLNTTTGVASVAVPRRETADGPVIGIRGDNVLALRTRAMRTGVLQQWRGMMHARDSAALYGQAARPLLSIDSAGRIGGSTTAVGLVRQASVEAALRADTDWTVQKLIRAAFDTGASGAEQEIAALVDEWEQVGARNPEKAQALDSAINLLRSWNHISSVESSAMTLYAEFCAELERNPTGSFRRVSALETVVRDSRRFPPQPWGAVNAIRRDGAGAMPIAGAPVRTGTIFTYDARTSGQHYVWAVDLRNGVAGSVLSNGEASDRVSPHWFDQAPLFAAGSLKPAGLRGAGTGRPYHPGEPH